MNSKLRNLLVVLIITGSTLAAHGWSLFDGLYLDDHWHRLRLADNHWAIKDFLEATTIQPDRFIETWWQEKPVVWQYLRPLAIFIAKSVYHLSGGSVKAWHAISILCHLVNALMVYYLCLRLTRRTSWSLVGALLFVVYSHNVFAVAWLAAQNIVLQTTLTLAALLCYLRATRLDLYAGQRVGAHITANGRFTEQCEDHRSHEGETAGMYRGWCAASVALWIMALLCRENAIVLPVILMAFDLSFGGWRHLKARWSIYGLMAIIGIVFVVVRLVVCHDPMPDFYVRRPAGDWPAYLLWLLAKLMHFYTAIVWLSPMTIGPSGRFNPFSEVPGDCLLMFVILAVLGSGYYLACRGAKGYWIWPLWILLGVLPILPVLATPHSGYMPSIGFAVGMILGPALRDHIPSGRVGRWSKGVAIWFLIATTIYMPIYRPMWYSHLTAERSTIQRILNNPPAQTATNLFFINLPFTNIYSQIHLQHAWGMDGIASRGLISDYLGRVSPSFESSVLEQGPADDFRCHVLTYCPDILRMDQECRVEQKDAYSFSVAIQGRAYFSGALGRFLIEGMRKDGRFIAGQTIHRDQFDVSIVRANEYGVWELLFRFKRPLASPEYAFYVGTRRCAAAQLRFGDSKEPLVLPVLKEGISQMTMLKSAEEQLKEGNAKAAEILFLAAGSDDRHLRVASEAVFRQVGLPVIQALAAPIQDVFTNPVLTDEDWSRVRQWWFIHVSDSTLKSLHQDPEHFANLQYRRDSLFRIREIAGRIIRTDLYLTGPPYPGPR